jgi:hypothetical protein
VISPYPTISQQLFGAKKLSFVGDTSGFKTYREPVEHSRNRHNYRFVIWYYGITKKSGH